MKLWHGHSPRVALAIVITQRQRVAAGIQDGAVAGDGSKSTRALSQSQEASCASELAVSLSRVWLPQRNHLPEVVARAFLVGLRV